MLPCIRSRLLFFFLLLSLISLTACGLRATLPVYEEQLGCYRVRVGDGTEDFVLDTWTAQPRLLVSSHERRGPAESGDIVALDLTTEAVSPLRRIGEPERLAAFKPHGMDIRRTDAETFLYVILHDPYNRGKRNENAVAIYRVARNELEFVTLLEDRRHLWSPNDLSVMASGEIYLTNDYRGSLDIYLSLKSSEVVHFAPDTETWSVAASDLSFANGILALPEQVFVTATRGNRLLAYPRQPDGTLGKPAIRADIKGPDNIMPFGQYLLVAAHFDDLAFLKHAKDPTAKSPSVIFLIPKDGAASDYDQVAYVDNGLIFSAASTALIHEGRLYASQVFDPYVLICNAPETALALSGSRNLLSPCPCSKSQFFE